MKTISLTDPNDVCFPFSKKWYYDSFVLYHGTSSIHSENIEQKGWRINEQPFDVEDFKEVCRIYEDIDWYGTPLKSGYAVLRAFTLGNDDSYVITKPASFSQDYLTARNYASNIGGESVHNFFLALDDIITISKNQDLQEKHKKSIETKLNKLLELQKESNDPESMVCEINVNKRFLNNMSLDFFNESKNIALKLLKKYEHIKKNHFPVVYALKVEPTWFEDPENEFNLDSEKNSEIRSKTSIPASSIIARVDFPKGANPYYG